MTDMTGANGVVEGFAGGALVLPCNDSIQGDLRWRFSNMIIVIKLANGSALPPENTPWRNVASFVGGSNNLSISSLSRQRDDNKTFRCESFQDSGGQQNTTVRVLVRITGVRIEPTAEGQVTVTEGIPKTLTCAVTGNPEPAPSYRWRINDGVVASQGLNYNLTADRSMRSLSCTATNTYSNGSVLSTAEATVSLKVLYLATPSATSPGPVAGNEIVTLRCSAQGNPPPTFAWRRSGSTEVKSTSADYRIENVQRSDAGEYTCDVTNSVGSRQTTVKIVVQYPSHVRVIYDQRSHTLTCTAMGVPNVHTFSPWEHRLGGTFLRRLGNQTTGTSVAYTLPDTLTYTDTGYYVCSATNGFKSPQAVSIYVAPLTPAVFQSYPENVMVKMGGSETISVSFYAMSSSGEVQVRWEKAGENDALPSHREEPSLVSLGVYGQQVSLLGTVTLLTLTDIRQGDRGNYSVTVISDLNGVTRTSGISFHLDVTDKPSTEKGMATDSPEANTGRIVGCVLGGLAAGVILTVLTGIFCMRSRAKDLPKGGNSRQMSPAREVNGEMQPLPRVADIALDPAVNTDHHYESTSHGNSISSGSRDHHYDSLTGSATTIGNHDAQRKRNSPNTGRPDVSLT